MASKKKKLVQQAKALGLDSVGTIYDLERRIAVAKAPIKDRAPKSEPIQEPEIQKDIPLEPKLVPKPEPPKPSRVHAVQNHDDVVTRNALKTTVKFIGRWYTLRRGKPLTAPKSVIDSLERGGFVESAKR